MYFDSGNFVAQFDGLLDETRAAKDGSTNNLSLKNTPGFVLFVCALHKGKFPSLTRC